MISRKYSWQFMMSSDNLFFKIGVKRAQYTHTAPSVWRTIFDQWQKIKDPNTQFWKKKIWGHRKSSRVSSSDFSNPYLSFLSICMDLGRRIMPARYLLEYNFWHQEKIGNPGTLVLKKKIVRGHQGSSRITSWDLFKAYFSLIGKLVWIW